MSEGLVAAVFDNLSFADHVSRRLLKLARAFETVGNEAISHELTDIADAIVERAQVVREVHSEHLSAESRQAEQMLGSTLALAVKLCTASATEAGTAETGTGSVHEGAAPKEDAQ